MCLALLSKTELKRVIDSNNTRYYTSNTGGYTTTNNTNNYSNNYGYSNGCSSSRSGISGLGSSNSASIGTYGAGPTGVYK